MSYATGIPATALRLVCISIVVYKSTIDSSERRALEQLHAVFGGKYDIVLVVGDMVQDITAFTGILGACTVKKVPQARVKSVNSYNDFCLTPEFYDLFTDYAYVFIAQLDGWVFYDALDWWASRGYDYVGGPWFFGDRYTFNHVQGRRVGGNGGMSLRNVAACKAFTQALVAGGSSGGLGWEDRVFSRGALASRYTRLPELCYPDYCDQARFCWNNPGPGFRGNPYAVLRAMTGSEIPMCAHQPYRAIYDKLCIPDTVPDVIFLFSNSITAGYDIPALIRSTCPDKGRRLFVAYDECKALTGGGYLTDLFLAERRFLTIHFTTDNEWVGPFCHFSSVGNFVGPANKDYSGRHDTLCVDLTDKSITHDGEIPVAGASSWLSGTFSSSGEKVRIVRAILHARYPKSDIRVI